MPVRLWVGKLVVGTEGRTLAFGARFGLGQHPGHGGPAGPTAVLQLAAERIEAGGEDGGHDEEAAEGAGQQPEALVGQRPQQRAADDRSKLVMDRLRQIAGWGEPWIFGVPTNESARYIQEQGLQHHETLGMASIEAAKRYLGWTEDRPYPAAIRQMYKIAEAVVPA